MVRILVIDDDDALTRLLQIELRDYDVATARDGLDGMRMFDGLRPDVVVLALPRGGVPVGYEVARSLQVPLDVFPPNVRPQIQPGFRFRAEHPTLQGNEVTFVVHQIDQEHAFVSGNHPLAGKDLTFDIEVVDVRTATADELSHGHAHGPGGHHHH